MVKRYIVILSFLLLLLPTFVVAEDTSNQDKNEVVETPVEESDQESSGGRMSNLIKNNQGIKEIKPIDLDEIGNKMLEFGDKSYAALQKTSVPLLVWGIGISVVVMFFGIILGKTAVMAGFAGLAITFATFIFIQFAPETAEGLMQGVGKFFGQ